MSEEIKQPVKEEGDGPQSVLQNAYSDLAALQLEIAAIRASGPASYGYEAEVEASTSTTPVIEPMQTIPGLVAEIVNDVSMIRSIMDTVEEKHEAAFLDAKDKIHKLGDLRKEEANLLGKISMLEWEVTEGKTQAQYDEWMKGMDDTFDARKVAIEEDGPMVMVPLDKEHARIKAVSSAKIAVVRAHLNQIRALLGVEKDGEKTKSEGEKLLMEFVDGWVSILAGQTLESLTLRQRSALGGTAEMEEPKDDLERAGQELYKDVVSKTRAGFQSLLEGLPELLH